MPRQLSISPDHVPCARLDGCVAIVTGAASGIGRETAAVFCDEGAHVFAADVNIGRLTAAFPPAASVHTVECDVRDEASCRALVDAAARADNGRIDVLVNNAGATIRGTIEETSSELFTATVEVNLASVARMCRLVAPGMRDRHRGSIINIASITASHAVNGAIAYTATKGGVVAMTRALAVELAAADVRVNAISPAVVDSAMTREHVVTFEDPDARWEELLGRHPMKRLASPRDVALAALFLASQDSRYITGAVLPVDGGRHAI